MRPCGASVSHAQVRPMIKLEVLARRRNRGSSAKPSRCSGDDREGRAHTGNAADETVRFVGCGAGGGQQRAGGVGITRGC